MPLNDPPREKSDSHGGTPEWALRMFVESMLIVISILGALAVDQWRDGRHDHIVAAQSLDIFEREIRANQARLADGVPYHAGLRDVVSGMAQDPNRAIEVRSIVEGLEPAVLLNTAWQTAVATGALTHMDVELVSALSLTYNLQQRFREDMGRGVPQLVITSTTPPQEKLSQIQQAMQYLTDLVTAEQQLQGVYTQALEIICKSKDKPDPKCVADRASTVDSTTGAAGGAGAPGSSGAPASPASATGQ